MLYGLWGAERDFALLVGCGCWLTKTCYWVVLDKNLMLGGILTKIEINPVSVFRVFDLLFIHTKPYENEFSTALSECKAVARCATRKIDTAINRIKSIGTCETVDCILRCKIPKIFNQKFPRFSIQNSQDFQFAENVV